MSVPQAGLDPLPWKDYLTVAFAAIGAGLGVMNTWNSMSQRRVRLRVRPAHAIAVPSGQQGLSIEVTNLSSFAVTIIETGLTIDGRTLGKRSRFANVQPILFDGGPWPRRLEARESVTAYLDPRGLDRQHRIGRAYARTACGVACYGSSPALRQIRDELAS